MPAFTVTSVDTSANTLTATGVATTGGAPGQVLTTGDRFRLRNVGGALPAATPSLAGATDYFAIRVSDNAIKISDTNAHAVAGTNIVDITGSGSGTTTIEFNLPYCVPRIAAPDGQVFSADDNAAWNALVAMYAFLTGQAQTVVQPQPLNIPGTAIIATTNNAYNNGPVAWSPTGAATGHLGIQCPSGRLISGVEISVKGDSSVDITADVYVTTAAGTTTPIGNVSIVNPTSTWTVVPIAGFTPTRLAAGDALSMLFTTSAANGQVGNTKVQFGI